MRGGPAEPDSDEPIDAVYTWVDGDDPAYRAALQAYLDAGAQGHPAPDLAPVRFQQHEELRYSLRSLAAHAPWIRRVYLVTNGQRPRWLNPACDRLTLVTHREIFPDPAHLPTFNSFAIQLHMHRIPGLSRRFLYLNDDFLLGRPVGRADFSTPQGGQVLHLERHAANSDLESPDTFDRAEARSQLVLRDLGADGLRCHRTAHVPILYDGEVIARLKTLAPAAFEATSASRLRSGDCIFLRLLYSYYLLALSDERSRHREVRLTWRSRSYSYLEIAPRPLANLRHLTAATLRRSRFICVNDRLDPPSRLASWQLRQFFRLNFPRPSEFEIAD